MAYRLEGEDIVVSGWEKGVSDDPFTGIADIRNANISTIPGEVSVNFSTSLQSYASLTSVSISSADPSTEILTITSSPTLVSGMTITLSGSTLPAGLSTGTIYWVTKVSNTQIKLSDTFAYYNVGTFVDITTAGTPGNWTFTTINLATPKYFVRTTQTSVSYWSLDSNGRVWINQTGQPNYWIYTGNKVPNTTNGNGLIAYQASDGTEYVFVIHNGSIDVTVASPNSINWRYQWDPVAGNFGAYSATPTNVLKSGTSTSYIHQGIVTPANQAIFCDTNWIDRFYEITGSVFDPDNAATYVWDQTQLLPSNDTAQCLTYLGTNVLVGGKFNTIYVWDQFSSVSVNYIFLAESNVVNMVTVNTNTYIFVGNRGRIYVTNGSNANPFKKVPDHISGTIEPYFQWGGAAFSKNILYFGFSVQKNTASPSGSDNLTSNYKGMWAIDLNTNAIYGANQLSGTNVYATAIMPIYGTFYGSAGGAGLFIGWADYNFGSTPTTTGIDATSSAPYASSETYVDTDMIPVGTYLDPFSPSQVEWKTSYPIGVNGTLESISIAYRTALNQSFVTIGTTSIAGSGAIGSTTGSTTIATTSGTGALPVGVSDYYQVNFQKAQWVQFRITMSSNATTPTYNRLTEMRIRNYKK